MRRINIKTAGKYFLFIPFLWISIIIYAQNQSEESVETLTKNKRSVLAEKHLETGMNYFHQEFYKRAIAEYDSSISLVSTNHLVYYFKGLSYEKLGDNDQALFNLNASLSIKDDFSEALFSRAVLYLETEKFEAAIEDLRKLLNIPAGETEAVYFRGINNSGNSNSTSEFDGIFTMSSQKPDVYFHLGMCYFKLESYDSAINNFTKAIYLNPKDDNIYVNRGLTYLEMENIENAKSDFDHALSLNPNNTLASLNLTFTTSDDHFAEIKSLTELIERNKNFAMAYAQRAYLHFLTGNLAYARMDYDTAIILDPNNYSYYLERGLILEKENKLNEAIQNYQNALALEASDYRCWLNIGNAYYKLEDYNLSIEYYDHAILLNPTEGKLYFNRGLSHHNSGNKTGACLDMEKAIQLKFKSAIAFQDTYCK